PWRTPSWIVVPGAGAHQDQRYFFRAGRLVVFLAAGFFLVTFFDVLPVAGLVLRAADAGFLRTFFRAAAGLLRCFSSRSTAFCGSISPLLMSVLLTRKVPLYFLSVPSCRNRWHINATSFLRRDDFTSSAALSGVVPGSTNPSQ